MAKDEKKGENTEGKKEEKTEGKKEEKKEEKTEGKKEEKKEEKTEEKKEKKLDVITVVYKVNLHCPKCARDIRRPLLKTPGVHNVEVKFEKNEVTVKGEIDPKKIQERLEKWSKKKVEIVSEAKVKESEKEEKETKKEPIKTIKVKAYIYCDQCEHDLRKRLLAHKGIHDVKIDKKAQTVTVKGVIEPEKLLAYMRKKAHKQAELIPSKEKVDEKKETTKAKGEEKKETTKDKGEEKKETTEGKGEEKKEATKAKVDEKKEPAKEKEDVKSKEEDAKSKVVVEFEEVKKVEVKTKEGETPDFIHYVYAPQLFSDENPNACSIM